MTSTGTAPRDRRVRPGWWRRPARLIGSVLARVFRDPVVYGRLRVVDWPVGLATLAVIAVVCYVAALIIAVFGPWLRRVLPLEVMPGGGSAPAPVLFAVLALLTVAVALFQIGALHAAWWVRVAALAVSAMTLSRFGGFGDQYGSGTQFLILAGCFAALLLLQLLRWRGSFSWWEGPPVLIIFAVAVLTASQPVEYARDLATGAGTSFLFSVISQLNYLAGPIAMAAGFVIAQLAFSTVVWTADLSRRELPGWALAVAFAALLAWRTVAEARALVRRPELQPAMLIWPVALLITVGLGWILLDRIADRRRQGTTRIVDLTDDLKHLLYPVALLLLAPTVLLPSLIQPLRYLSAVAERSGWSASGAFGAAADLIAPLQNRGDAWGAIAAAVLLIWAGYSAWRGDRGRAELLLAISAVQVGTVFSSTIFSTTFLGAWLICAVLVLTGTLLVRRRLTPNRVQGLLVLTGVATVVSTRDVFADPFEVLLGGSAALLLGLLWTLLSGGDDANGDSRWLPRPARVCLLFANSLFGMAVLAFHQISSQLPEVSTQLDLLNSSGDALLGGGLLLGAAVAIGGQIWRGDALDTGGDLAGIQPYGR